MSKSKNIYPKYSVLMSVYFKEKPEWLDFSINSMLNQTVFPDEFVIVEDGKLTNELDNVIEKFKNQYPDLFKIIKIPKNGGLGPALRLGVINCSNEYIARMDSDDYSIPTRCELELKKMIEDDLDIIGSTILEFEDNINNIISLRNLPERNEDILKFSKRRNPFGHPSLILKKSKILEAGNYREYYLCEDYDLWVRMIEKKAKCYNIQTPLVYMRISKDFYMRRGGWKYLKSILKFKNEQLKSGYFSLNDYLKSTIPHIIVCLLPNIVRDWIYRNLLRKKSNS